MNGTLNDFVIASGINVSAIENETLDPQTNDYYSYNDFERVAESASQNQFPGSCSYEKVRKTVDKAVLIVETCMHDAIVTATAKMLIIRVEMPVRSFTGSLGQKPDWRDFTGNSVNTPLMSASSRLDLSEDQDRDDETRNIDNFEHGNFPAIKLYDRRAHTHHIKVVSKTRIASHESRCNMSDWVLKNFDVILDRPIPKFYGYIIGSKLFSFGSKYF